VEPSERGAPPPEPLERLRRGPLELLGRIVDSSNGTFLVSVGELDDKPRPTTDGDPDPMADIAAEVCVDDEPGTDDDEGWIDADPEDDSDTGSLPAGLKGVYKPLAGERPLWDFPEGLYRREIAAYELSVALGWDLIPATVERDDTLGVGSLQRFVEADFSRHYFVLRDEGRHDDQLLRMGVFDLLVNNTDRKGGHVLIDADEHIWGIDNGLCFSTEARLRTVIWDFAGEPVPDDLMDGVTTLLDEGLPSTVTDLLLEDEIDQLVRRCRVVRSARQMPHDPTGRAIPWPLV
jgi:uncharacterized repeat protein (TIGR03843 family)